MTTASEPISEFMTDLAWAAKELAQSKALFDATDKEILIAAAELAEVSADDCDLSTLGTYEVAFICAAYDRAV